MKSEENGIIVSMGKAIIQGLSEPFIDFVDINLDGLISSISNNELLSSIPVFKTIIGVCKTGLYIADKHFLRETMAFISELSNSTISKEKKEKYKSSFHKNPKFAEKEVERVIILLNKHIDTEKSKRLGKLFGAFVEEKIDWEQFCELSDANSRLFEQDYSLLRIVYYGKPCNEDYQLMRLAAIGLLIDNGPIVNNGLANNGLVNNDYLTVNEKSYICTQLGNIFVDVCES